MLHDFKPYKDVVANALIRTCKRNGVEYRDSDAETIYAAIPSWGPHPDVVEPLMRVAKEFPIVGLTNSMIDLIPAGIRSLKAPFHAVITAEETGAYKPHMQGFEYMLDKLGAKAEEVMHVSSSFRYDLMTAADMDFGARVHVDRNHEPLCSGYATHQIKDLGGLPGLLGSERPYEPRLSRLALAGQRFVRLDPWFIADFFRKTGGHFCEICLDHLPTKPMVRERWLPRNNPPPPRQGCPAKGKSAGFPFPRGRGEGRAAVQGARQARRRG